MRLVPGEVGRSVESRSRSDEDDGCGRHDRHDLDETARGRESLGRVVETNLPRLDAVDLGVPDGAEPLSNAVVLVVFRRRWVSPLFAPTADRTRPESRSDAPSSGHPGLAIEHMFD